MNLLMVGMIQVQRTEPKDPGGDAHFRAKTETEKERGSEETN